MKLTNRKVLEVKNLKTHFFTRAGVVKAVDGVDFEVNQGEIVGLVGESGCGKTVTANSILRLIPYPGKILSGEAWLEGENLFKKTNEEMREIRGNKISMIFQDPLSALNPVYSIGWQIREAYKLHQEALSITELVNKSVDMLEKVQIPDPQSQINAYPHQFSGGMRQRVLIAMALVHRPSLVLADEPTTALDVTVQAKIMDLLNSFRKEFDVSIVLISHDLHLIMERCDRIYVMYAGHIVESATSEELLKNPLHPYTQGLFDSVPQVGVLKKSLKQIKGEVPSLINLPKGCPFSPRCEKVKEICRQTKPELGELKKGHFCRCHFPSQTVTLRDSDRAKISGRSMVKGGRKEIEPVSSSDNTLLEIRDLKVYFPVAKGLIDRIFARGGVKYIRAVDGISFKIGKEETVGLIGESGCGKTTTGRAITLLTELSEGKIFFEGVDLTLTDEKGVRDLRPKMQFIFQDPFSSLNPRMSVRDIIGRPLQIYGMANRKEREKRIQELLQQIGLSKDSINKYPHEFSGGQRQRISIARALAVRPKFIVADEPTSSLDVSIQAQILNLLIKLKEEFQLALLLITHNLAVVSCVSDKVAVMYLGKIIEVGRTEDVFQNPLHPYTKALLSAVPKPKRNAQEKRFHLRGTVPSAIDLPSGCRLHPRCPYLTKKCREEEPMLIDRGNEHYVACHLN